MQRIFTRILSTFLLLGFFIIGTTNIVAQNCNTPTNVSTTTISNFSATLNWDTDSSIDHYRLRYHEIGASSWMYNHNVPAGNFYNLTGLDTSVSYEWQLKSLCSAGNSPSSAWSVLQNFTTTNYPVDCNNTPNGIAWIDSCGNCVGGATGNLPCIGFTPTVSITLSSVECDSLTDFSFTFSQDPNEPDVASAFFTSDGGYFDFTGLSINDTVGSSINMIAGGQIPAHNITTTLLVDFIVNSDKISVKAIDDITGQLYSSFTIENTANGILIIINSLPDNNNVTQGNSQWVVLTGLFTNPGPGILTFTSTINSEIGDVDVQTFPFTIVC
ncbi:MAG: fibronectin type III domain-containing protein, partial [Flavobacteriales bacterium]|nr:fibronectin type III domain-containing protein [Flavobacteriales bacterium]